MNFDEELLIDYLKRVFNDKPTTSKRLILWNTFGCELNEELSQFLEKNKINNMLIPSSFDVFNEVSLFIAHFFGILTFSNQNYLYDNKSALFSLYVQVKDF